VVKKFEGCLRLANTAETLKDEMPFSNPQVCELLANLIQKVFTTHKEVDLAPSDFVVQISRRLTCTRIISLVREAGEKMTKIAKISKYQATEIPRTGVNYFDERDIHTIVTNLPCLNLLSSISCNQFRRTPDTIR